MLMANDMKRAKNIIRSLNKEGRAYFVGGSVRDLLSGRSPRDYDIVTDLLSKRVLEMFPRGKYVGESFGVVLVDGNEVAGFRKGRYEKGADAPEPVDSLLEDLGHRDFTINAMAMDIDGNITDPFNGRLDLENRVLRFVGDPEERILEDPCRILRAFRFMGEGFAPDSALLASISACPAVVQRVAVERIRKELLSIMGTSQVYYPVMTMQRLGVLKYIMPALAFCDGVVQNEYHKYDVFEHSLRAAQFANPKHPLLRLATLVHDIGKPACKSSIGGRVHFYGHEHVGADLAEDMLSCLKFSKRERAYICDIIRNHLFRYSGGNILKAMRKLLGKINVPVRDLLRFQIADNRARGRGEFSSFDMRDVLKALRDIEKEKQAVRLCDLALSGHDLIELGFEPSPRFNIVLNRLLTVVVENPSNNRKDLLLELAKRYMADPEKNTY